MPKPSAPPEIPSTLSSPPPPSLEAIRARELLQSLPQQPNGQHAPPPRNGRATASGGKSGRYTHDNQFVSTETIVENVRALFADSWTVGDIKRVLVKQFGGVSGSFNKHIALARKRNLAQLGRKPEESKSDAMQQWQRLLVEAQQEKKRCYRNLLDVQGEVTKARSVLKKIDSDENPEKYLTSLATVSHKEEILKSSQKAFDSARYHVDKYQNTIDNMLGHKAPAKTETTSNSTLNVKLAKPEPLTLKDADEQLKGMLKKLRSEYEVKEVKNLADRSGDNEAVATEE